MRYGVINADMIDVIAEFGEHVDWTTPDVLTESEAEFILGDVAAYAASNPHMIIFEIDSTEIPLQEASG